MVKIVGIDPGVQPSMALRDTATGFIEFCEDTSALVKKGKSERTEPRPHLVCAVLRRWKPDIVCIEAVTPIARKEGRAQGLASTANFMRARGILEGCCAGLSIQYELVAPQQWQRDLRIKSGHELVRAAAINMFPAQEHKLKLKKDHNKAAALMLAIWIERYLLPNHPLLLL